MSNEIMSLAIRSNELGMTLQDMKELATVFVASGRFPNDRDIAQIIVKIQAGAELGIKPFEAMANIYFVNGARAFSYPLVGKLIKRTGKYRYDIREVTDEMASIEFFEKVDDIWQSLGIVTYTTDDAKSAGLLDKANWKKYRRDMLVARCLTRGARWHCGDASDGPVYTKEELEESMDIKVENKDDDLSGMKYSSFVEKVKLEVDNTLTRDVITELLKDGGFKWEQSSKRIMFDYIKDSQAKKEDIQEAEFSSES